MVQCSVTNREIRDCANWESPNERSGFRYLFRQANDAEVLMFPLMNMNAGERVLMRRLLKPYDQKPGQHRNRPRPRHEVLENQTDTLM
jgi:hypothetical protein